MDIKKYLTEKKATVDKVLEEYFAKECDCPVALKEAMLYSLRAGGKRVRPVLCIASAEACGGKTEDVIAISAAFEMIHTFSLIHDDLPAMDNDDLRRGLPTSHKKFGEATAILVGDALLAEAFSCLASFSRRPEFGSPTLVGGIASSPDKSGHPKVLEIIRDIADATGARGMTGGQLLDMEAAGKKITYDDLRNIHRGKTGALITVSVTSGAKAAGADKQQLAALTKYGESIGLAFQISDDILDIEGTTEELGKPAKSDIGNKKSTYPSILGMEKSKKLAKEQVDAAYSALAEFDAKADPLREIARYIISRKS
jgi:geranylgeranyl diphosphate synthase type II